MRQSLFRLVCDDCGFVAHFETMNSEPLTATLPGNVQGLIERAGWTSGKKEGGSSFNLYDRCPHCTTRRGPARC
jgi:hypothetical protein